MDFELKDARTNKICGYMKRVGRACGKSRYHSLRSDETDVYFLEWPKHSSWQERAMLTNLSVFVDYLLFEEASDQERMATQVS